MAKTIYTEEYRSFQKLLKRARKEAGYTQVEVADALGEPQSYISKIESGDRRIDVIEFWTFAKLYGKPVDFFFRFEETDRPKKRTLKAAVPKKK
ncbi:DNA-binding helix-turn-helix protein [Leptospira fainei serovar Hurstbridge str. BUT 6]|uniref:DNA-binding helix-turn-helix protein n=1 Tax=Leptospira fainei serovar Hurstbridge str. BUT 6 TaxID=1193011 RepID=S3VD05_9LEPT|nr:helix-turn-helix transcriptional regulator [Leptospira fainei]EPG74380.1 DNA-binding helix-turn-helix protein [Leptospira fainei serovar Hurstbridge str. BUT 6]